MKHCHNNESNKTVNSFNPSRTIQEEYKTQCSLSCNVSIPSVKTWMEGTYDTTLHKLSFDEFNECHEI